MLHVPNEERAREGHEGQTGSASDGILNKRTFVCVIIYVHAGVVALTALCLGIV